MVITELENPTRLLSEKEGGKIIRIVWKENFYYNILIINEKTKILIFSGKVELFNDNPFRFIWQKGRRRQANDVSGKRLFGASWNAGFQ